MAVLASSAAFAEDFIAGLRAKPRAIAPKWFYDEAGSKLFERICALPEYYPTRTELALLQAHGAEIAERIGPGAEIVEFGAGANVKVRRLLGPMREPRRYVPVDISADYLQAQAQALQHDHPRLQVRPLVADFTAPLELPAPAGRRLGFFPGSSIGNFDPAAARALLTRFRGWLAGGALLIGVDLVKDPGELHAAYNDAQGVTAAFNLNLLARANRELDADFDLARWAHSAFYQPQARRIEMHLVSRCAQRVRVAGHTFEFDEGDSLHTEYSYKYTVPGFRALAEQAGFAPAAVWIDAQRRFSLHWLEPA